jgi:hypothetical protein
MRTGCRGEYLEPREKKKEDEENYVMRNFIICTPHKILLR